MRDRGGKGRQDGGGGATGVRQGRGSESLFFSSRRRHTRYWRDWSSDVCSSDLPGDQGQPAPRPVEAAVQRAWGHRSSCRCSSWHFSGAGTKGIAALQENRPPTVFAEERGEVASPCANKPSLKTGSHANPEAKRQGARGRMSTPSSAWPRTTGSRRCGPRTCPSRPVGLVPAGARVVYGRAGGAGPAAVRERLAAAGADRREQLDAEGRRVRLHAGAGHVAPTA